MSFLVPLVMFVWFSFDLTWHQPQNRKEYVLWSVSVDFGWHFIHGEINSRDSSVAGSSPSLFTAVVSRFAFKKLSFSRDGKPSINRQCKLKISALSVLQVVYLSGNMAATKQIIGETLLKRKTTKNKPASPDTPPFECGAPALFSSTVGSYRAQLKCVLIEPAVHSLHCVRNVWLPAFHRNPHSFVLGGTILQCHVCVQWWGEGAGSAGVLTSVADSFLRATWHAVIPWMGIREHMSKALNANEDIYSFCTMFLDQSYIQRDIMQSSVMIYWM